MLFELCKSLSNSACVHFLSLKYLENATLIVLVRYSKERKELLRFSRERFRFLLLMALTFPQRSEVQQCLLDQSILA